MINTVSSILGIIASSMGYFPNLPIKVAVGAIIVQIAIVGIMTLSLLVINKSSQSK